MNTRLFLEQAISPCDSEMDALSAIAFRSVNRELDQTSNCPEEECWRFLKSPAQWGCFVKGLLASTMVSEDTKSRACHLLFKLGMILDENQEPCPWMFHAIAWLSKHKRLDRSDILGLRKALIRSVRYSGEYLEDVEDISTALFAVLWFGNLKSSEKTDIIITSLLAREVIGNQGRFVFDRLMLVPNYVRVKRAICKTIVDQPIPFDRSHYKFPFDTTDAEKDLLSVRFTPGGIRRVAVMWVVRLEEDPVSILNKTIRSSVARDFGGDAILAGSIDVLDETWSKIDKVKREKLLNKAISMPDTGIRKRAYLVGEERIGPDFLKKTLKDKAKSIRKWGRSRLNS